MTHVPTLLQEERYRNLLEEVEARLAESERERYSRDRGRDRVFAMLRAEAPSGVKRRRVNLGTARTELNSLLYQRYALQHGYFRITEMTKQDLAAALLGPEAADVSQGKIEIELSQARTILKEQWRYGRSPLLEDFQKKVQQRRAWEQRMRTNYCRKQAILVMEQFHRKWRQWAWQRQFNNKQQRQVDKTTSVANNETLYSTSNSGRQIQQNQG